MYLRKILSLKLVTLFFTKPIFSLDFLQYTIYLHLVYFFGKIKTIELISGERQKEKTNNVVIN